MNILSYLQRGTTGHHSMRTSKLGLSRYFSCKSEDSKMKVLLDYMENLKNYEKIGVPKGAGTNTEEGFDLGRMERLMRRLGNPQSKFKAVHIAGTKGKGSTAAFLSNILRESGYSVGCYSSPHICSIRERICLGVEGNPVSAELLRDIFYQNKKKLDESIKYENGTISHFEVFTALAFLVFAKEKVDIAIIEAGLGGSRDATNILCADELTMSVITTIGEEHLAELGGSLESITLAKSGIIKLGRPVVLGGPFERHIEQILRDKASLMKSPVVSASDNGVKSAVKYLYVKDGIMYNCCDLLVQVENDFQLFIRLLDLKLRLLGTHQLQNAATATCAALCLRHQGWNISNESIRKGLEETYLLGRCQFLKSEEAEAVGVSKVSILIDGAHTQASAKALADTIKMTHPDGSLAFVIAMARDKDHLGFARQLLAGRRPDLVFLTEVNIAGDNSRTATLSSLKDAWIRAIVEFGFNFLDMDISESKLPEKQLDRSTMRQINEQTVMLACNHGCSLKECMKMSKQMLGKRAEDGNGLIVVTGSLHIVPSILALIDR